MKKASNNKPVTRDVHTKGDDVLTTYEFPRLGVTVQAATMAEAQAKAEAKAKKIKSKGEGETPSVNDNK